ncbi:OmpA family protein [Rhizobium sp. C4]|uniref:OmpA family protein n=1 Tax=Rhizobium sp. C4 TaxID=1349800 RepID=UPI001E5C3233|nr:OmpA family protein [Rhizobium sp. C4]MCD2171570.1 OmpA family protein [Rhizobium sp. C4]
MKARKHLLTHVFVSLAALPVAMPPAFAANVPAIGQAAQIPTQAGLNLPAHLNRSAADILVAQAEEPKPEPPPGEEGKPKKKPEAPAEKPPAEPPKAEAPKAEPPKPEPPKPEPPKPEPPKPEPKAEAPKPAAPVAEPPKAEAPKPAAPKAEAPAPEAPKPEKKRPPEPDAQAKPPAEKPAAEAPKPAAEPKPEKPAAEAPKPAETKPAEPKPAEPKPAEKPAAEAPKPAAPAPAEPKPEAPKADAPKAPADAAPAAKSAPGAEKPVKPGEPSKPAAAGEAPAPAGATKEAPAAVAPNGQQAPVLDSAKSAPVLDSAKPAPGAAPAAQPNAAQPPAPGQPAAPPAPGQAPATLAPAAPAGQPAPVGDRRPPPPPPTSDADAQAPLRNAPPPPPPPQLAPNSAGWDRGQRMQAPPRYDAPRDAQVEGRVDGRDVLSILGQMIVRGGDSDRFNRGAEDSYFDQLPGGRTRETIERPNGVMIVTIRNRYGDVIQRSRIGRDGRETVLFYAPDLEQRPDRERVFRDPSLDLPPMQLDIPVDEYIIDTSSARNPDYYDFLREPPVERVERVYSLDEVRYSARIRDKMRRIDLDTIHFATGSAEVSMNEAGSMKRIAQAIKKIIDKNPGETFLIEGHTDAVGSDQSNLVLSDRRAESVAVTLSELYDIPPENLVTQGYGERFLKVQTAGPSEENRRVTIRRITPLVRPVANR